MPSDGLHPLADYGLQVVTDWIEVRVTLAGPSQPQHIRARIARALPHWGAAPYVQANTDDPSRTSRIFTLRIQDPCGPDQLMADVQALRRPGDPPLSERDFEILAVEVALDAYPRTPEARADLAGAALHFWRHHARPPTGTTRICRDHGDGEIAFQPERIRQALAAGWTVNVGDKGTPHTSRYYLKDSDSKDGIAYKPLPVDEHRARMEIALAGERCPFTTINDWRGFKFTGLAKLLALRTPTAPDADQPPMLALLRAQLRHGKPDDQGKRAHHKRLHRTDTTADTTANKRIYDALRALTRRQAAA